MKIKMFDTNKPNLIYKPVSQARVKRSMGFNQHQLERILSHAEYSMYRMNGYSDHYGFNPYGDSWEGGWVKPGFGVYTWHFILKLGMPGTNKAYQLYELEERKK